MSGGDSLEGFHPLVRDWFASRFSSATPIQQATWPRIVAGEHVLVTAPTGSGKTLTAFLAAINAFVEGRWETGATRVLYVSPLKALNNDIHRNLLEPIAELRELAGQTGFEMPDIVVATRSGDTPQHERRRMLKRPPEILITTPETLNIILTSPRARSIVSTVRTVILDEVHAVVGEKRGTHLITAVERLTLLAGEFQRIAVSATVRPLELVARFVGGYALAGDPGRDAAYRPRDVSIVQAEDTKRVELAVDFPDTDEELEPGSPEGLWPHLVRDLRAIIDRNRSTLVFVTTRRHAEKLTMLLNDGLDEPIAYSHHGSLSRELRHYVERALKEGKLRAIVATNSLELGIDIGSLDEVLMVRTPTTVSSTLQRVGRAGHRVGETSRGTLYPLFGRDMVDAAAMTVATLERDIEAAHPVVAPLDVLAQVIVSMTAMDTWQVDDLYSVIRTSWPYHTLERRLFDLVVEMLAGRYAETRIRELRPRVSVDRISGTITAREGVTALLYQSGGTIPDRGYYAMKLESGGPVGELDEEFVWERRVGETFVFGAQAWTITSITDRDVVVTPAAPGAQAIPFWRAEARGRDAHYARRLLRFLESCEGAIEAGKLEAHLADMEHLSARAREGIADVLTRQRDATGTPLPHLRHIVVENVLGAPRSRADADVQEVIVHTGWGGRVNRPLAIALAALWERGHGVPLEVFADNDCLILLLPTEFRVEEAFGPARCRELVRRGALEDLLRERLERSGTFGALFRENAGRALLLPRGGFSRRMPLWLNRLRSKKLLSSISGLPDFPILLETWRQCLNDEFDLPALREMLEGAAIGEIAVSTCETLSPSPFAAEVVWQQINLHMYQDDSLPGSPRSGLSDELMREAVFSDALRPRVPPDVVDTVTTRLARLAPGYAPAGPTELLEWFSERLALPADEVVALRHAVIRDHGEAAWTVAGNEERLVWISAAGASLLATVDRIPALLPLYGEAIAARPAQTRWWAPPPAPTDVAEAGPRRTVTLTELAEELYGAQDALRTLPQPEESLLELLRFAGPVPLADGQRRLGLATEVWRGLVSSLHEESAVVVGEISENAEDDEVCDAETLEYLLRVRRSAARVHGEPVPPRTLVPLWAETTGLASGRGDPDALIELLDTLFGYPAPAASWEADIIPARLDEYYPLWLDGLFSDHELVWLGAGGERLLFCLASETELFAEGMESPGADAPDGSVARELGAGGPADLLTLHDRLGRPTEELTGELWEAAWRGEISNDTFATVRRGIETRFTASSTRQPERAGSRWPGRRGGRGHREWRATRPLSGTWFALDHDTDDDPLSRTERDRERARVLLRRYGIVFPDLVRREGGAFVWRDVFRALRLMELAGEIVSGVFVENVATPQFALRSTIELLERARASTRIVWMSAVDPASPCGLGLGGHFGELPVRRAGNHLVFRGSELVLTSRRNGGSLSFAVEPDDPDIAAMLAPLRAMAARRWNPLSRVVVETVNDRPVRESPYAPALRASGFRDEFRAYVLSASYR